MTFEQLPDFYQDHLLVQVMPFWLEQAIDWKFGGIFTGIDDDGTVNTTDKYIWSNARARYTFSALYNRIEKDTAWLKAAGSIFEFCYAYGRTDSGWAFPVDREGDKIDTVIALPVKDPFHLPRALILCIDVLKRFTGGTS